RIYRLFERYCIKYADKVITVSNSIAEEYKRLYKIDKPCLILNSPNIYSQIQKKDILREKLGISNKSKILIYQGILSKDRGNDIILDYFKMRSDLDIVVVFMGYTFDEELLEEVKSSSKKYKNIFYVEAVPVSQILDYTSSADFGISMVKDTCLSHKFCLPNKFFEYAMAGLPVISSNNIEMMTLVEKYDMGVVVEDFSVGSLDIAINNLLAMDYNKISLNARRCAEENSWEVQEKRLLKLYQAI
ncbi:glycosyltransferase, partial [Francisella philomiragia]|uniref:glycosyltransferase n=1 Tax=Francisella philomiragia TaxID=28110 RepID=UPI001907D0CD